MRTDHPLHASSPSARGRSGRALRGAAGAVGFILALALASSLAAAHGTLRIKAKVKAKHKHNETEHVSKEPFGNIPKGPLQIIISIDQQKLHLYSDGTRVAEAMVATGVAAHPTPLGVFSVIDKERFHRSNIYSGAPMPYMQRITWSGVAMHEGVGLGHPASHGCIRMPGDFAARLWLLHSIDARVIIARPELRPAPFADPHLFVHKEPPPAAVPSAAAPATVEAVKTAQTIDSSKTSDAGTPPIPTVSTEATRTVVAAADTNDAVLKVKSAAPEPVAAVAAGAANDPPAAAAGQNPEPAQPAVATGSEPSKPAPPAPPPPPAPDAAAQPPIDGAAQTVPLPVPLPKPAALAKAAAKKGEPIAIFISRKTSKIYLRQNFAPLFAAPITIADPQQPLGTHVFTALEYLDDGATLRWNVVSLSGEPAKAARKADKKPERDGKGRRRRERVAKPVLDPPPPETPRQALARIEIPQDVIDQISALIVPGSSLIVSDQGLGEETGEGTGFIVVTR